MTSLERSATVAGVPQLQNTILDDLASVIGYTPTRRVALLFSGRRLCVPRQALDDHALASLIGESAFRALVREFAGEEIFVPSVADDDRARRDIAIAGRLVAGESYAEIATALNLSYNRVRQIADVLGAERWTVYAAGYRSTARGRLPLAACASCGVGGAAASDRSENFGTGEVSAEPPPPCAAAVAA